MTDQKKGKTSNHDFPKLQKFLANLGLCSRRKGEEWIVSGSVSVNGETVKLGCRINPEKDVVKINGKRIQAKFVEGIALMVNKPKDYTCSNQDEHAKNLIFELLEAKHRKLRLFCAGRLDVESQGLVILTNDGNLAHRLTHPSMMIRKKYQVEIDPPLKKEHLSIMLSGFQEGGEFIKLDEIRAKNGNPIGSRKLEVILCHGKKREIRRVFAFLKYKIVKLRRISIGGLRLGKIPLGQYRELTNKEIDLLFPK